HVPRLPVVAAGPHRQGLVGEQGSRGEPGAATLRLEGGQIDEGLEDRSRLARGPRRPIERAVPVATAAHHGPYLPRARVHGEGGGLYPAPALWARLSRP